MDPQCGAVDVFIGTVHSFCFKNIVLPYGHLSNLDLLPNPAVATEPAAAPTTRRFGLYPRKAVATSEPASPPKGQTSATSATGPRWKSRAER
jgi:hypothetical protein